MTEIAPPAIAALAPADVLHRPADKRAEKKEPWIKDRMLRIAAAVTRFYFHAAPWRFGKPWLWRHVVEQRLAWRKLALRAKTAHGAVMDLAFPDLIQTHIYFFGVWEPLITRYIRDTLGPGDIFIDVGANIGYHTLLASGCVGSQGRVIAVEASPSIHATLGANIKRNRADNVRTVNVAAGAEVGEIAIYLNSGDNLGATTTISALATARGGVIETKVPMKPLLDIVGAGDLLRARMIKIDVEGAEWPVVQGIGRLLPGFSERSQILVEINRGALATQGVTPEDFIALFRDAGFSPYSIENEYNAAFYIAPPPLKLTPLAAFVGEQVDVVFKR